MPETTTHPIAEARPEGTLAGQVALVTGAVGALGQEICLDLARAGAQIAVHHLDHADEAAALCSQVEGLGVRAVAVSADITSWHEAGSAVSQVAESLGNVGILINNAGIMESLPVIDSDLDDWRRTLSVDLDGVFVMSRRVLPGMLELGSGCIINVSSQLAFKGAVHYAAYAAAKAGILGFTKSLAREVGPQIRVNAIAPGPIDTPMVAPHATDEWVHTRTRDSVIGRLGRPEEVAPAVTFLAGPGARLIHGQTLHLNGGGVMA